MTVIVTLAVTHEEAMAILPASESRYPRESSNFRVNRLTGLLWEEHPWKTPPDDIPAMSRTFGRTLSIFHRLLFANHPQAPFDLERKIRPAPPSTGVDHVPNVMFGRISLALDLESVPAEAGGVVRDR